MKPSKSTPTSRSHEPFRAQVDSKPEPAKQSAAHREQAAVRPLEIGLMEQAWSCGAKLEFQQLD
jgi:hypothetical protein